MNVDTFPFLFEHDAGARPVDIQQTYLDEEEAADIYVGLFWKGYGPHTTVEFAHEFPDVRVIHSLEVDPAANTAPRGRIGSDGPH